MSCGGRPTSFLLEDLKDLRIGDTKQMNAGCGPNLDGDDKMWLKNKGFGWPENGEFEWGGRGDGCSMCSFDYGCECTAWGAGIGGSRGKVKRSAFKGDPTQCCLANISRKDASKIVGDYTCDPIYRDPNSTDCTNVYSDYCKVGDRILTDDKCKSLASSNFTLHKNIMKEKCNLDEYYMNSSCIDWCSNNSTECTKLNTFQDCRKYSIPLNECTSQKVTEVKGDCQKYGLLSEQGLALYGCSVAGISSIVEQCRENKVLDTCSPTSIQDAIDNATRAAQLDLTKKTQEQIQQNYDKTQETIAGILNIPTDVTPTPPPTPPPTTFDINTIRQWILDNSTIAIFVAIIIIVISSSSSASLSFLLMSRKR